MCIVLVCGGRDFDDQDRLYRFLDATHAQRKFTLLVNGGSMGKPRLGILGADRMATMWAASRKVPLKIYKAEWDKYGARAAGPIRNLTMLVMAKPDLVVAFPGGPGTADMVSRANMAGVEILNG